MNTVYTYFEARLVMVKHQDDELEQNDGDALRKTTPLYTR